MLLFISVRDHLCAFFLHHPVSHVETGTYITVLSLFLALAHDPASCTTPVATTPCLAAVRAIAHLMGSRKTMCELGKGHGARPSAAAARHIHRSQGAKHAVRQPEGPQVAHWATVCDCLRLELSKDQGVVTPGDQGTPWSDSQHLVPIPIARTSHSSHGHPTDGTVAALLPVTLLHMSHALTHMQVPRSPQRKHSASCIDIRPPLSLRPCPNSCPHDQPPAPPFGSGPSSPSLFTAASPVCSPLRFPLHPQAFP